MWPPSSYAAASFFPACLCLAAACGSFPGQAGISGNVCCFRGAKSRLRSLSHSQTSTQTRKGWPTTTSTHSHKPLSHQAEPLTHPKVQIYLFTVFLTCSSFKQLLGILVKTHQSDKQVHTESAPTQFPRKHWDNCHSLCVCFKLFTSNGLVQGSTTVGMGTITVKEKTGTWALTNIYYVYNLIFLLADHIYIVMPQTHTSGV